MTRAVPVQVAAADVVLDGDLTLPAHPRAVVLFAHGSGSSRHSPRNRQVADALVGAGAATLLMDLLTGEEDRVDRRTREFRFDVGLLGRRLTGAVDWLANDPRTASLPVVTFGASTGAAAALIAAANRPERVLGVISRGGRPDLAADHLAHVHSPVLLIVGSRDPIVLDLNRTAAAQLSAQVEVVVVPGATHLFEEAGTLDAVIGQAVDALSHWLPQ
jgi:predicted alpha/beta-hydrolase family hydrolase